MTQLNRRSVLAGVPAAAVLTAIPTLAKGVETAPNLSDEADLLSDEAFQVHTATDDYEPEMSRGS